LVAAALAAGGADNATALVLDVIDLPSADAQELDAVIADLPIPPLPKPGDTVDGYLLGEIVSDGRYSRLFRAREGSGGPALALKFPHPRVGAEQTYRLAFVREAYVAARVRSPFVGEVIEAAPGRRSRLYTVMPFYEGETLERRVGRLGLAEGVAVAVKLARALDALHRIGVAHRDVKPDNVILTPDGGLKLIDLGVARASGLEDFAEADIPGTPSYMAPELFEGRAGDEASDLYALGVTIYRLFAAAFPYGEVEPFMTPRFDKYAPLAARRPDLPAWLDAALAKAVAVKPSERYGDAIEFAHDLETALARAPVARVTKAPLYERNPLLVWQAATGVLALIVILLLAREFGWSR
jgi:serine/threonine protein kinase